jgi:hypothetical protein
MSNASISHEPKGKLVIFSLLQHSQKGAQEKKRKKGRYKPDIVSETPAPVDRNHHALLRPRVDVRGVVDSRTVFW